MSTLDRNAGDTGDDGAAVVRSEEHLHLGTALQEAGRLIVRKLVGERHDRSEVERDVEQVDVEHVDAEPEDSGEIITLADGSLSIPVFEEQIVVRKQLVVRERIVVRKYTVAETQVVEGDVRVERVEIIPGSEVEDRVDADGDAADLVVRTATATDTAAPEPELATATPVPPDVDTVVDASPVVSGAKPKKPAGGRTPRATAERAGTKSTGTIPRNTNGRQSER